MIGLVVTKLYLMFICMLNKLVFIYIRISPDFNIKIVILIHLEIRSQ